MRRPTMPEHQKDDTQKRREADLDRDEAEDVPAASTQEARNSSASCCRGNDAGLDMFSILVVPHRA